MNTFANAFEVGSDSCVRNKAVRGELVPPSLGERCGGLGRYGRVDRLELFYAITQTLNLAIFSDYFYFYLRARLRNRKLQLVL